MEQSGAAANHRTCKSRKPVPVVLLAVAETTKLSVHFVIDSGQECLYMLSYVKSVPCEHSLPCQIYIHTHKNSSRVSVSDMNNIGVTEVVGSTMQICFQVAGRRNTQFCNMCNY